MNSLNGPTLRDIEMSHPCIGSNQHESQVQRLLLERTQILNAFGSGGGSLLQAQSPQPSLFLNSILQARGYPSSGLHSASMSSPALSSASIAQLLALNNAADGLAGSISSSAAQQAPSPLSLRQHVASMLNAESYVGPAATALSSNRQDKIIPSNRENIALAAAALARRRRSDLLCLTTPSQRQLIAPSPQPATGTVAAVTSAFNTFLPGRMEPFPERLHRLLLEVEASGRSDVISFVSDDTFRIHDPDTFTNEVVPLYFRQTKLTSFKRQLKLYGFELISYGHNKGGYRHDLFSKKDADKCRDMKRVAIKGQKKDTDKEEEERSKHTTH